MWMIAVAAAALCPSIADVDSELVQRRGTRATPLEATLHIGGDERELVLELDAPTAHVVRRVPRPASCAAAVQLVATIVAAWESEIEATPPTLDAPLPRVQKAAPQFDDPEPPAIVAPPPAPRPLLDYEVGAAFMSSWAFAKYAPGAMIDVRLARRGLGVAGYVGVLGENTRTLGLGFGDAEWTRAAVRLGCGYRLARGRFSADVIGHLALGLLSAVGRGYVVNEHIYDFDAALGAGVRLGVRLARVRPFLGFDLDGWLRDERLSTSDRVNMERRLPRFQAFLYVGLALTAGGEK